jgi:hypothetical protein
MFDNKLVKPVTGTSEVPDAREDLVVRRTFFLDDKL